MVDTAREEEREFFLQSVDEKSGLAVTEQPLGRISLGVMREIVAPELDDPSYKMHYPLDERELDALRSLCGVEFDPQPYEAELCSWSSQDGLPYRVHSNRELILMLAGTKPLTFLTTLIPHDDRLSKIPEYLFDPHVETGRFVKREYSEPMGPEAPPSPYRGSRIVLYALAREAWRIDAYVLLRNVAMRTGWSEALTRIEGTLLGYEEWQNDAYFASGRVAKLYLK
jgi:hypothetical protein